MADTLEIIAGTTFKTTITITDSDDTAIDITSDEVKFKIAEDLGEADDDAEFYASTSESNGELTISDGANGQCTLEIPPATTALFALGDFKWQIRHIASGVVSDTDQGICIIKDSLFEDE